MQPSGWDYNLTKRCVKTTQPTQPNYYEETSQCVPPPIPGIPGKNWTVAISSENANGVICPAPAAQSFLINSGGPITLVWMPHTDEFGNANWSVNMKTDLYTNIHPCGAGYFTWYAFLDHIGHNGGPLPKPDQLQFSSTVYFNDFLPNGSARALAEFQGYWGGKSRYVDVAYVLSNWGDNYPGDPMIYEYRDTSQFTYISVNSSYFGINISKAKEAVLTVNWASILNTLIASGRLPGYDADPITSALGLSHEIYGPASGPVGVADLWFTNFRISQI